ncbi:MAG TPA: diacylglycerol kinase [Allosphingosinicella sp.]|jgi:diacylglycerol kinase (ATP)
MDTPCDSLRAKNQPFRRRLGFALKGIGLVFRRERSFRAQTGLAMAASAGALFLAPGPGWAAAVILSAGLVLALEQVNAAIEYLCDHLHPGYAAEIGAAKDAVAGAVLVASLASLGVASALLWALFVPAQAAPLPASRPWPAAHNRCQAPISKPLIWRGAVARPPMPGEAGSAHPPPLGAAHGRDADDTRRRPGLEGLAL